MTRAQLDLAASLSEHADSEVRDLAHAFVALGREVQRLRSEVSALKGQRGVVAADALHEFDAAVHRLKASLRGDA